MINSSRLILNEVTQLCTTVLVLPKLHRTKFRNILPQTIFNLKLLEVVHISTPAIAELGPAQPQLVILFFHRSLFLLFILYLEDFP